MGVEPTFKLTANQSDITELIKDQLIQIRGNG